MRGSSFTTHLEGQLTAGIQITKLDVTGVQKGKFDPIYQKSYEEDVKYEDRFDFNIPAWKVAADAKPGYYSMKIVATGNVESTGVHNKKIFCVEGDVLM